MKGFEPKGLGKSIFQDRYAHTEDESFYEASKRVVDCVAQNDEAYKEQFLDQISSNKFMPGGRVWYGAGRQKGNLMNCFVVESPGDSREGWGDITKEIIVISGLGGGVGSNFSSIRPRGSEIKGTGGVATGSVSLMDMVNKVGDVIVAGGGRRLALMLCLDVDHPDLKEFINAKSDLSIINNANVSVVINNEDFFDKVKNNENYELKFDDKVYGEVNAREVWETIVRLAWENGEPGILNGALANKMNNIWYYKELKSTNPCGEQWLESYGSCNLGALVLPRFVKDGNLDTVEFEKSIRLGVRFLDNILDNTYHPFDKIKENVESVRRVGLGVMGLHTMLLDLGMQYSSEESKAYVDFLFDFIKEVAYDESVELAKEKGSFPAYDPKFLEGNFVKTLTPELQDKIKEHGIRNCNLLTVAPTGTTSMVAGVTSGIEPLPAVVYWRTHFTGNDDGSRDKQKTLVVDPAYEKYGDIIESACDLTPRDHFEIQKIVSYHIDNSVSKTINLPTDYTREDLSELWLEYAPHVKGTTLYRWGARKDEPISPIAKEDWATAIELNNDEKNYEEIQDFLACPSGVCEL